MSDQLTTRPALTPSEWAKRRRVLHLVLGYCACFAPLLAFFGPDNGVSSTLMMGLVAGAFGLAAAYFGFATWDDKNRMGSVLSMVRGGGA